MQFEKNVPIPAPTPAKYPFPDLQPGESVLYPCADNATRAKARKAAYRTAEYHAWNIVVRSLPDGIRVWRNA